MGVSPRETLGSIRGLSIHRLLGVYLPKANFKCEVEGAKPVLRDSKKKRQKENVITPEASLPEVARTK